MNAAETIAAAIEKLERLRGAGTRGTWTISPDDSQVIRIADRPQIEVWNDADADLIVTLHRTIDAQLAILRVHLDAFTNPDYDHDETEEEIQETYQDILDLARAILGVST